jgi:hypothetical protein
MFLYLRIVNFKREKYKFMETVKTIIKLRIEFSESDGVFRIFCVVE